jgi:hypothetical protein
MPSIATPPSYSQSITPTISPKLTPDGDAHDAHSVAHDVAHEIFVSNGPRDHIRARAPKRWSPYVYCLAL